MQQRQQQQAALQDTRIYIFPPQETNWNLVALFFFTAGKEKFRLGGGWEHSQSSIIISRQLAGSISGEREREKKLPCWVWGILTNFPPVHFFFPSSFLMATQKMISCNQSYMGRRGIANVKCIGHSAKAPSTFISNTKLLKWAPLLPDHIYWSSCFFSDYGNTSIFLHAWQKLGLASLFYRGWWGASFFPYLSRAK